MARPRKTEDTASFDLEVRIAELETALRPFAEHGKRLRMGDRRGTARKQVYDEGTSILNMGHFDEARRLILGDSNGG